MATKKKAAKPAKKAAAKKAVKKVVKKVAVKKAAPKKKAAVKGDRAKTGKIKEIIILHKKGKTNKEIVEAGYNSTTVSIQVSAYKRDPKQWVIDHPQSV